LKPRTRKIKREKIERKPKMTEEILKPMTVKTVPEMMEICLNLELRIAALEEKIKGNLSVSSDARDNCISYSCLKKDC
jgi:hypothetical protein